MVTVIVLVLPDVSIPVPPAIVSVSVSKSIDKFPPLSPATVKSSSISNPSNVVILVDIEDDTILISGCDKPLTRRFPNEPVEVTEPLN